MGATSQPSNITEPSTWRSTGFKSCLAELDKLFTDTGISLQMLVLRWTIVIFTMNNGELTMEKILISNSFSFGNPGCSCHPHGGNLGQVAAEICHEPTVEVTSKPTYPPETNPMNHKVDL